MVKRCLNLFKGLVFFKKGFKINIIVKEPKQSLIIYVEERRGAYLIVVVSAI